MNMKNFLKSVSVIVLLEGALLFTNQHEILTGGRIEQVSQFETIEFGFTIYTVRGHEYLGKDGVGLVHMADCKLCESKPELTKDLNSGAKKPN